MLIQNQKIALDFESKIPIKITSFSYKEGEIDKNGIEVDCLGVSVESGATITAHWLYSTQEHYVYVENAGSRIDGKTVKVVPPQNVLYRGEIGLEVHLESAASGLLKSQTASIPVVAALVNDEEASAEDENLNVILNLINATSNLHDAAVALDAEMQAAEVIYSQNEAARTSTFKALETSIATNISSANTAITNANTATTAANTARDGANTAANNADSKATLANTAAANANTAATGANTAKTALDGSISTANTTKTAVDASATNANTKATLANDKAILADQKATLANTAATNANTAATNATNAIAEVVDARVDYFGTTHADVDERIKADFNDLASRIPSSLAVNGYESVTTNDTLSGEVSSAVLSGQTMVNVVVDSTKGQGVNMTVTYSNGKYIVSNEVVESSFQRVRFTNSFAPELKTYTVVCVVKTLNIKRKVFLRGSSEFLILEPNTLTTVKMKSVVTKLDTDKHELYITRFDDSTTPSEAIEISNILILEGDHTDKPLEFFEGLKSAEVAEISTHGVNLLDHSTFFKHDDSWEAHKYQNAYNGKTLHLKPNTSYVFEWDGLFARTSPRQQFALNFYLNASSIGVFNRWNDTTDTSKVIKLFTTGDDGEIGFSAYGLDYDWIESFKTPFHIYEVTPNTPAEYIPYQSSTTSLPSPVILRSLPNGVADTYDFDTQTLTRRCGEVVLNGSESWRWLNGDQTESLIWFSGGSLSNISLAKPLGITSDKLVGKSGWENTKEGIYTTSIAEYPVLIYITKSKLPTPDVAGFKAWLAQNPTKVVYQLETPTTEYIENNGQLRSYDSQTTVFANSIVPVKIGGNIPVNYASTLSSALSQVSLLKAENQLLRSQMETQVAEVRDELNQVHAAMYRMMNFNQSEEGDHVIE